MSILVHKLNNGVYIPAVALGTWQLEPQEAHDAIQTALAAGYRCVDDAWIYQNEEAVGKEVQAFDGKIIGEIKTPIKTSKTVAISEKEFLENFAHPHGPPKDKRRVFVTSKIWIPYFFPSEVPKQVDEHLGHFGRSSCDLMILHWPGQHPAWGKEELQKQLNNDKARKESWMALEREYAAGRVRAIGVSNYMAKHLKALIEDVLERQRGGDKKAVIPMYNQIELNPFGQPDEDLAALCEEHNILIASYSTIGGKAGKDEVLNNELLCAIARKHNRSVPNIILRWGLQRNYQILPKSRTPDRIKQNFNIFDFELSADDMKAINSLHKHKLYNDDPRLIQ